MELKTYFKEEMKQGGVITENSDISQKHLSSSHSKISLFLGLVPHSYNMMFSGITLPWWVICQREEQKMLFVVMNALVCQLQIKELEEQLENQSLHKEISRLKQQLELLEEDKKELELKCQHAEEKARDLKHSGKIV